MKLISKRNGASALSQRVGQLVDACWVPLVSIFMVLMLGLGQSLLI